MVIFVAIWVNGRTGSRVESRDWRRSSTHDLLTCHDESSQLFLERSRSLTTSFSSYFSNHWISLLWAVCNRVHNCSESCRDSMLGSRYLHITASRLRKVQCYGGALSKPFWNVTSLVSIMLTCVIMKPSTLVCTIGVALQNEIPQIY